MADLTLEQTLQAAEGADAATRVPEWRDPVAAFGMQAVDPLVAWLPRRSLGRFALATLSTIGSKATNADRRRIVTLFQGAADTLPAENHTVFVQALGRLGIAAHAPGLAVIGSGAMYHVVIDHVGENPTEFEDLYLTECGFAYSGGWVRRHGGVLDSGGRVVCLLCQEAMKRGFEDPIEKRRTPGAPDTRTWVLRNTWHEVFGWAQGPRVGDVYLTRCWRWIMVSGKDVAHGRLYAGEQEACLQCVKAVP